MADGENESRKIDGSIKSCGQPSQKIVIEKVDAIPLLGFDHCDILNAITHNFYTLRLQHVHVQY